LKSLRCAINTLVVSTADCERAFSCMNETLTATRNSLAVDTLSSPMFMCGLWTADVCVQARTVRDVMAVPACVCR